MRSKFVSLLLTVITYIALVGCSIPDNTIETPPTEASTTATLAQTTVLELDSTTEATATPLSTKITKTTSATTSSTTQAETTTTTVKIEAVAPSFSLSDVPPYSGSPYVEINNNTPFFTEFPSDSFEIYSPLDNLGRCGVAYANIGKELMPTDNRGEIGAIKPSGWHTANYSGIIEDIYLYNRCHLIGYQLAGENANERNLITGTRYMNVEGMEPFENKVANYVLSYNRHPHDAGKLRQKDIKREKNEGNMPLMVAAWDNRVGFVKALCADERTSINQQDKFVLPDVFT